MELLSLIFQTIVDYDPSFWDYAILWIAVGVIAACVHMVVRIVIDIVVPLAVTAGALGMAGVCAVGIAVVGLWLMAVDGIKEMFKRESKK